MVAYPKSITTLVQHLIARLTLLGCPGREAPLSTGALPEPF
jgi:hypothetical protein